MDENWTELKERLRRGRIALLRLADDASDTDDICYAERLRGKAGGLGLALSYMEEQERMAGYE